MRPPNTRSQDVTAASWKRMKGKLQPPELDQCSARSSNRRKMRAATCSAQREQLETSGGRSRRRGRWLARQVLSCCAVDEKRTKRNSIVVNKLVKYFDKMPNDVVACWQVQEVQASYCPHATHNDTTRPHSAIRSLNKSYKTIANLVFISTIICLMNEHSVTTTQAIKPPTASPAGPPVSWRHHEQLSYLGQGFTSRRLNLAATAAAAASPVYRSVDELEDTTQQTIDLSPTEESDTKILALHGQLQALRRQLELELRKSKTPSKQEQKSQVVEARTRPPLLGSPCLATSDCTKTVKFSHCKLDTFTCSCLNQHVELNSTTCLPPALLGYECTLDAQCQQRVPESVCQLGKCACRPEKFVAHRKSKCLPAARINDYCLADDQCHLNDKHSYCKWKIPNVYGTCKCPPNYKLLTSGQDGALRCTPRLGDTCLSDQECQQTTKNSICLSAQSTNDEATATVTKSRRRTWLSSSASTNKCTCANGFVWSPSQLECLKIQKSTTAPSIVPPPKQENDIEQRAKDTTTTATQALDSHKYETVIANSEQQQQQQVAQLKPDSAPLPSELEINFVPLAPSASSSTTTTTTTTTTGRPIQVVPSIEQHKNVTITPGDKFRMSSLGKPCSSRQECQARDPYSDCVAGICECQAPSERCGARSTGCHPDTFQCRNGQCISWYFVCDQFRNCDDGSDEEACRSITSASLSSCPPEAFQCHSDGACLTRGKICNGKRDCSDGSDEFGCDRGTPMGRNNSQVVGASASGNCPANSFTCYNGQCLPAYVFCNAVEDCADASDEDERLCGRGGGGGDDAGSQASATGPSSTPPAISRLPPELETSAQQSLTVTTTTTSRPPESPSSSPVSSGLTESPLVKTDRASIERLMAALALTQRTPEKRGRGRKTKALARQAPSSPRTTPTASNSAAECPRWAFTCRNGKCRSSAILCSGVDGCGDNSDEDRCEVCQCEPPGQRPNDGPLRQEHKPAWQTRNESSREQLNIIRPARSNKRARSPGSRVVN